VFVIDGVSIDGFITGAIDVLCIPVHGLIDH
jgi:hypothetical protein